MSRLVDHVTDSTFELEVDGFDGVWAKDISTTESYAYCTRLAKASEDKRYAAEVLDVLRELVVEEDGSPYQDLATREGLDAMPRHALGRLIDALLVEVLGLGMGKPEPESSTDSPETTPSS